MTRADDSDSMPALSARDYLRGLYKTWRTLTDEETEAINAHAWSRVHQCQACKRKLQDQIVLATEELNAELVFSGLNRADTEVEFRRMVEELILLESRNGELIANRMDQAREEQSETERSARNLRQVHRAYSSAALPAWCSYS
jgi:serine phosphatase RsbU (regulator of sigma subunit)